MYQDTSRTFLTIYQDTSRMFITINQGTSRIFIAIYHVLSFRLYRDVILYNRILVYNKLILTRTMVKLYKSLIMSFIYNIFVQVSFTLTLELILGNLHAIFVP